MTRISLEDAKRMWLNVKPVKSIQDSLIQWAINKVNNKYWAKKKSVDNITFHSTKEANRYSELKLLEKAWNISDLILQPKFLLQESFKIEWVKFWAINYISDFQYKQWDKIIVEDVKWVLTDIYKLKKKLFLKIYWNKYKLIET